MRNIIISKRYFIEKRFIMYDIFISYRRDGGEALACLLCTKLRQMGCSVFYDVESLRSGKFNTRIFSVIQECTDVIVVLPERGLDRCIDENDWVRKEIAYSIANDKNIIPVMMRNFEWPKILPEEMGDIVNYNGVSANMEYFDATFEKLLTMLRSVSGKSMLNRAFYLLYYSFSPYTDQRLIRSKLIVKGTYEVRLYVNMKDDGKYEYSYCGTLSETDNNYYIHLNNNESTEKMNIVLYKPAGNLNRFIGIITALSPAMTPVSFKCACFDCGEERKINEKVFRQVLKHENREWNNELLALETYQINLFYSDVIYM